MTSKVFFEVQGDSSVLSFTCPKPITPEAVIQSFPLAGQWHFRVKVPASANFHEYMWMDFDREANSTLPMFNGTVYLKALPVDVTAIEYDDPNDYITVKGYILEDDFGGYSATPIPNDQSTKNTITSRTPVSQSASSISMFGRSFATSAKAAMDAVRKNVGT